MNGAHLSTGFGGAMSSAMTIGGFRAEGGPVKAGVPYVVGEQGPEMFKSTSSPSVVNYGGVTIKIEGSKNPHETAQEIKKVLEYNHMMKAAVSS